MMLKIFTAVVIVVAVVVGACALALPRDEIVRLIMFRDFFDVSLPILAFGALVKYLCSCRSCKCNCCSTKTSCSTQAK